MAFAEGRVPLTNVGDESGQHLDNKPLLQVCSLREQTHSHMGQGLPAVGKGRMAISDLLWVGLIEKGRKACGGEIRHAEEPTKELMGK